MKKYIDCDGVILDTKNKMEREYLTLKKENPTLKREIYVSQINWNAFLREALVLNDAIYLLREYNPTDINILTEIYSLEEASAKVCYFKEHHVSNNIIFVPHGLLKTNIVQARGNILVDDSDSNLKDWEHSGGYSFALTDEESDYLKIKTLDEVLDSDKLKRKMKKLSF